MRYSTVSNISDKRGRPIFLWGFLSSEDLIEIGELKCLEVEDCISSIYFLLYK